MILSVTRSIYGTQNGYLKPVDNLIDMSDEELIAYANSHENEIEWEELPKDFDQFDEFGDVYCASLELETRPDLNDYDSADFIVIEDGNIRWEGYFYLSDGWHHLAYDAFETSLEDFVNKYHNDPTEAYEDEGVISTQYILSERDLEPGTNAVEYFMSMLEEWLENTVAIDPKNISVNTPNGRYVLLTCEKL